MEPSISVDGDTKLDAALVVDTALQWSRRSASTETLEIRFGEHASHGASMEPSISVDGDGQKLLLFKNSGMRVLDRAVLELSSGRPFSHERFYESTFVFRVLAKRATPGSVHAPKRSLAGERIG